MISYIDSHLLTVLLSHLFLLRGESFPFHPFPPLLSRLYLLRQRKILLPQRRLNALPATQPLIPIDASDASAREGDIRNTFKLSGSSDGFGDFGCWRWLR